MVFHIVHYPLALHVRRTAWRCGWQSPTAVDRKSVEIRSGRIDAVEHVAATRIVVVLAGVVVVNTKKLSVAGAAAATWIGKRETELRRLSTRGRQILVSDSRIVHLELVPFEECRVRSLRRRLKTDKLDHLVHRRELKYPNQHCTTEGASIHSTSSTNSNRLTRHHHICRGGCYSLGYIVRHPFPSLKPGTPVCSQLRLVPAFQGSP